MGAERFDEFGAGADVQKAFDAAHDKALYDYGHRGYTGSLAEKHEFALRNDGKPVLSTRAVSFADDDLDENDHDKWGPAWAVAVHGEDPTIIIGYHFYGYASS